MAHLMMESKVTSAPSLWRYSYREPFSANSERGHAFEFLRVAFLTRHNVEVRIGMRDSVELDYVSMPDLGQDVHLKALNEYSVR